MPSDKALLQQAALVRDALKAFLVVRDLDAPSVIRAALSELIIVTVRLASYSTRS
jgi:hypothetical protein